MFGEKFWKNTQILLRQIVLMSTIFSCGVLNFWYFRKSRTSGFGGRGNCLPFSVYALERVIERERINGSGKVRKQLNIYIAEHLISIGTKLKKLELFYVLPIDIFWYIQYWIHLEVNMTPLEQSLHFTFYKKISLYFMALRNQILLSSKAQI